MERWKKRVAAVLESRPVVFTIITVIVVNVVSLMVETVEGLGPRFHGEFLAVEHWSIAIFTLEYVLRMWSCTVTSRYSRPVAGRLRFAFTPFMLIDFIAIAPFYLPFLGLDLRVVRVMRLVRVFRMGKLIRYSRAMQTLIQVLSSKRGELGTALFILLLLVLLSATTMYYAEHATQPAVFSSIPASMWWAISTLSTVGYGDIVPTTQAGKAIAAVITVLGIGMFALPAGILGAAYTEAMENRKTEARRCPHCGKPLKD